MRVDIHEQALLMTQGYTMININKETAMDLFDLQFGIDSVDGKKKYIASYVYKQDTYRVIAEIKSEEPILFPQIAIVETEFKLPIRYRFEGYIDNG